MSHINNSEIGKIFRNDMEEIKTYLQRKKEINGESQFFDCTTDNKGKARLKGDAMHKRNNRYHCEPVDALNIILTNNLKIGYAPNDNTKLLVHDLDNKLDLICIYYMTKINEVSKEISKIFQRIYQNN
jgi:hypothetical protein